MEEALHHNDKVYTYDPLPDEQGYFRYIVLKPGSGDDLLYCDIHIARIDDVSYEAISYVWGSEEEPEAILRGENMIPITVNLHAALARLRLPNKTSVLWADSICIDQDNLLEKGHQVVQLSSMYRDADRVLICLDADEDGHAIRAPAPIGEVIQRIQMVVATIYPSKWNAFPWPDRDDRLLYDARWISIAVILRQGSFTRGWVVREAAFAQAAIIIWGSVEVTWSHLVETLVWATGRGVSLLESLGVVPEVHVLAYETQHLERVRMFWSEELWNSSSLLSYLNYGRSLGFRDARDRLFAF